MRITAPFALLAASLIASAAHAESTPDERNEAIATLSASVVTMQKMSNACTKAKAIQPAAAKTALDGWKKRNAVFLYTQSGYLDAWFKAYSKQYGAAEAKKARDELTSTSNSAADDNAKVLIANRPLKDACPAFFNAMQAGNYDVKSGYPYYPVLKEMVDLLGLSG